MILNNTILFSNNNIHDNNTFLENKVTNDITLFDTTEDITAGLL